MSGVEKTAGGPGIGDQVTAAPVVIARSAGDEAIPVHDSAATADSYVAPKEGEPATAAILPDGNLNAKIKSVLPEAFPSRVRKTIYDTLSGLSAEDLAKQFYPALLHHALDYLLGDEALMATFPEDIRQALDAKLTPAAREHNRNLILEVLVPWLAGWQTEAIKIFLADSNQFIGLLTWHIPPAVKTQFQLVQAAAPGVVEAELRFRRALEPQALFVATERRLAKTPGEILAAAEKYWLDKNPGAAAAILNHPERAHRPAEAGSPIRHWQLMEALRNLIPQDAKEPYTVLELGAGIIGLSPDHPFGDGIKPLHNPEPVELAALLPERGRLKVFDISLLVTECLADGCQQLALVPDVNEQIFPGSRDYMDRLSSISHTKTGWAGRVEHRLITVDPAIMQKIKPRRMDVAVDSFGNDQVDLAFTANLEQYLFETGSEDRFVQVNLLKMVHAVKVGGHVVLVRQADSKSLPPLTPAQRTVLGLELVREVPTGQRSTGYIYKKIAATDFVEEMHAQIASVQERARMEHLGRTLRVAEGNRTLAGGADRSGWREHLATNKAHILKAAEEVSSPNKGHVEVGKRPTVMVLGAGNCTDIPLAELARDFHVMLVDLDHESLERAVSGLPLELRPYVALEVRDISGNVVHEVARNLQAFMERMERIPDNPEHLIQAVLEHLDDFDIPVPNLTAGRQVDFLVSSMVASQVSSFAFWAFILDFVQHYGGNVNSFVDDMIWRRFCGRVAEAHAVALARHVHATGGVAYYSSDLTHHEFKPTDGGRLVGEAVALLYHPDGQGMGSLHEHLYRHGMVVTHFAQWSWDYASFRDYSKPVGAVLRDHGMDPATFVSAKRSVEGGVLKSDRSPAFAAALPTHIYASSRLGPADQTPASVILHPTIRGGEFDPAHIAPYDKDLAEHKIDALLVADHLYEDAIAGIPMQRNDMLGEAIFFKDGSGGPLSALDAGIYLAQTEFARVSGLWAYLRDELLPLFAGRSDVVAASFGPGFSLMKFDDTLPRCTTYEPYLLAAHLPATSRVHVYDWAPEVSLATQQFKGRMAIATIWHYVEKETLSPAEEAFLLGRLGPSFRVMLKNSKAFFERFIAEKGVRIVREVTDKNFEGVDATVYILEWPSELYRSVIPSPEPRNFIFAAYEPEALDLAFFQLGGTDYISGDNVHDYSLSVATLIRIVHQLKPGGYLVTDPYVTETPFGRRLLRYSPDPGMMQALGLEAVFDLRATTAPATNKRGIVFRKVGPSNSFVLRMIERLEGAYARARAELPGMELQVTDHEIQTVLKYVSEHPPFTVERKAVWTKSSSMVLQGDLTEAIAFHRSTHVVIELDVEDQADAFVHLVNEITPQPSPVFGFIVLRASGKPVGYRSFILDASNSETVSLTMQMVYVVSASRGHSYTDWIDQSLVAATLFAYRSSHDNLTLTFSDVRNQNHVRRYAAAGMEEVVAEFDIDDADDDTPMPFATYSPVALVRAAALGLGSSFRTTFSMGALRAQLTAPALPPEKPADTRTTSAVPLVVANWSDFFAMYRRLPRHQQIIKHGGEDIMIDADHPEVLGQLLVKNSRVRQQFETVLGFLEKDASATQMERCSTFRRAIALLQDASGKYTVEWDRLVMKIFEKHKTVVPVTMDHDLLSTVDSRPSTDGAEPLATEVRPPSEWHARRTIGDDPHRYIRDMPMTDANLKLVGTEWMRAIIDGELSREVLRLRGMTREARVAEALERLDLGPQHTWLTASGFICTPASYRIIEELLRRGKHTGSLHLASVGAGYLDLAGATVHYALTLKQLFGMYGLPHAGVTIEAFEMLSYFLPPGTEGSIDVLDWDPRVEAALTEPTGRIVFPVFDALMRELREFELDFAARIANANERLPGSPHVWRELLYEVLQIPAEQRSKLRITQTDFATESLPQSPKWHVAFYLQAAYFMPLVVQRAMFIKLVQRMAVNGIIVSDFMLTEAEAAMLGISIVYTSNEDVAYEGYLKGAGDRDKHTRFYQKGIDSPVVEHLAEVIRPIQPPPKHKTVVPKAGTSVVRQDAVVVSGEVLVDADEVVGAELIAPDVGADPCVSPAGAAISREVAEASPSPEDSGQDAPPPEEAEIGLGHTTSLHAPGMARTRTVVSKLVP